MEMNLKQLNNLAKAYPRILHIAGVTAVNFYKARFYEQNWIGNTTESWKRPRYRSRALSVSGRLKRSIRIIQTRSTSSGDSVLIGTDVPYARIHNEGGKILVTPKMRKYFWAKYYELAGSTTKTKKGRTRDNARNRSINQQAEYYKNLALTKKRYLKMPKRQFLGYSQYLEKAVTRAIQIEVTSLLAG